MSFNIKFDIPSLFNLFENWIVSSIVNNNIKIGRFFDIIFLIWVIIFSSLDSLSSNNIVGNIFLWEAKLEEHQKNLIYKYLIFHFFQYHFLLFQLIQILFYNV